MGIMVLCVSGFMGFCVVGSVWCLVFGVVDIDVGV